MGLSLSLGIVSAQATDPSARVSPIVRAIQRAEAAVVSIQGNKVIATASASGAGSKQEVNGMGTGVIIDRRGYIITNLHVVEDVGRIEVTLSDGSTAIAKLLNYDPSTDLALIKIPAVKELPTIQFGTSSDLMRGETVVAIGNPFGYQNTVTQGIVNVAVRVGAQGIGFAIPIDSALEVMANLVASIRREPIELGMELTRSFENGQGKLILRSDRGEDSNSQALYACDIVEKVNGMPVQTRLDVELALLESRPGDSAELSIARAGTTKTQTLQLQGAGPSNSEASVAKMAWEQIGIRLAPAPLSEVSSINEDYRGGLRITEVRPGSPAARNRLMVGDIIVGIMEWQTVSMDNLQWILASPNFKQSTPSKYYVIRKRQQLMVAMTPEVARVR